MTPTPLTTRIRAQWRLKLLLSLVLTNGFTAAYFLLQRHPLFPVTVLGPGALERRIPFLPGAVYLYESLWLILPVAPWLMTTRAELRRYSACFLFISLVAFAVFFFFPTSFTRPRDPQGINAVYAALIRLDRDLNALPSLHVALAVFSGACCQELFRAGGAGPRLRGLLWVWVAAIAASTLLTRQHGLLDALAGGLLGLGGYALFYRRA